MDCFRHRRRHHSNVGHLAVVIIVCVSCLLMADISTANFTHWCLYQDASYNVNANNQGICGPALSTQLRWVCRGRGYNSRVFEKRAIGANRSPDSAAAAAAVADALLARLMEPREAGSMEERSYQFLDGSNALGFLQYKRQSSSSDGYVQNIGCECCVNSCTNDELKTYCRPLPQQ